MAGSISAGDLSGMTIEGGTDGTTIGNVSDSLKTNVTNFPTTQQTSDTELATFVAYAQDIAIGNNKSMVSLVNTSGSSVVIKIREIRIMNVQTTAVTGVIADMRLLRITNHSAGTAITPVAHDTGDTLNGSVTARTGATVTSELTPVYRRWKYSTDEWGVGTLDVEALDQAIQKQSPLYEQVAKTKPFTLRANEGFTIKQVTNSTVGTFDLLLVFTQE
jgi:hypothetical protein